MATVKAGTSSTETSPPSESTASKKSETTPSQSRTSANTPTTNQADDTVEPASQAIVDDTKFDHGTRYRAPRNVPPTLHLGGMPTVILSTGSDTLDEDLPEIDPNKLVVPPSNIPLERLVQTLVDKALSEKDKEELTEQAVFPGAGGLSPEQAQEAASADAQATEALAAEQEQPQVGTETVKSTT